MTHRCRAVHLIEKLIDDGVLGEEDLARELVVRPTTLNRYRAGTIPVPLERQLCLALFMTQLPGKYARMGFALRGQVQAASLFARRATMLDSGAPSPPGGFIGARRAQPSAGRRR